MPSLSPEELLALVKRVFRPDSSDRALTVLVDLPDRSSPDRAEWKARREAAAQWVRDLAPMVSPLGLEAILVLYRNSGRNNGELPTDTFRWPADRNLPDSADQLDAATAVPLHQILEAGNLVMAPTEFSATAPLKVLARDFGFRAATMGGFSPAMIPALRIDYGEVNRRVDLLKGLLDRAYSAELDFEILREGTRCRLVLDLRHRFAHASGGLFHEPGMVGNLPSGEAYIVPYEGEKPGDPSRSKGRLPVQFEDGLVVYEIQENRAVAVQGKGQAAARERELLSREPAYGNLAELGLGVIRDFGIRPCGSILLDEKLGLHIAFGRSDHFGGRVGPADFRSPEAVVHIDRVYIEETQPGILTRSLNLELPDGEKVPVILDGSYVLDFTSR